jgi:DNA-binding NarL/FixJ family response regulator/tetratricopeptide (TPR) repeat protein
LRQGAKLHTELHRVAEGHERTGDIAREHHLYEDAAQRYHDALSVQGITSVDRLRLSKKLADALSLSRDPTAADLWYDHFLSAYYSEFQNDADATEVFFKMIRQLGVASKTKMAITMLTDAIRAAQRQHNTLFLKRANIEKARILVFLDRFEEASRCLEAVNGIDETDSADIRVRYLVQRGFVDAYLGHEKSAFENFERAIAEADNSVESYLIGSIWHNYAYASMVLGRTEFAKTCFERALLVVRKNNIAWQIPQECLHYARLLARMGQFAPAHEHLLDALSYNAGAPVVDGTFAAAGIPIALHVNDAVALTKCARINAIDRVFASGEPSRIGGIAAAFAALYVAQGNLHKAKALLRRAVKAIMGDFSDAWGFPLAIVRYGAMNDIPYARRLLQLRAALPCAPVAKAYLEIFDAFAALRKRHIAKAYVHARDAASQLDSLQLHADADLARSILPEEERSPSVRYRHEKPFSDVSTTLSDREREVAALMLKGLTNRAIAETLDIKERTVEAHMTSIMSRLRVRSRYQLMEQFGPPEH